MLVLKGLGADVAQGRVFSGSIMECLYVVEDGKLGQCMRVGRVPVNALDLERVPSKYSCSLSDVVT